MKKIFILLTVFFIPLAVYPKTLDVKISYDWVAMAQTDRDNLVNAIVTSFSKSDCIPNKISKNNFKELFAPYLKDKDNKLHYYQAKTKVLDTNDYTISGFFKGKILIMYALQYKNDKLHNYYYDVYGNLVFVDYISCDYPSFPYFAKQFYKNGNVTAYFYYLTDNMQFIFDKNFKFKGVWQNDNMYDLNGKVLLTRSEFSN